VFHILLVLQEQNHGNWQVPFQRPSWSFSIISLGMDTNFESTQTDTERDTKTGTGRYTNFESIQTGKEKDFSIETMWNMYGK